MLKYGLLVILIVVSLNQVLTFKIPFNALHDYMNEKLNDVKEDDTELHEETLNNLPKNGELFEGDIKMDDRIRDAILNKNTKKSAIVDSEKMWPGGVVVYEIRDMDPEGRKLLAEAMAEIEKLTCIRFRKKTDEDENYVVYTSKEDYCASNVGMISGMQEINLGLHCHVLGTFLHETMHALGFIHEQSRADRDDHIKIKWENIKQSDKSNFNKYSLNDISNYGSAYNFASVMHYRNDAFTKNGEDTIVAKNDHDLHFGQREKFSMGDVDEINRKYNCNIQADYKGLYHNYGEEEISQKKDRMRDLKKRARMRDLLLRKYHY